MGNEKEIEIIKVMTPYLAAFPQSKMDQAGLMVYSRALKELTIPEIDAAMMHLMRTKKFFPAIAEIFEAADTMRSVAKKKQGVPDAGGAWKEAIDCVKRFSVYKEWEYSCDEVKQACKRFGVRDLCELESDNVNTARAQFMKIYNEILNTARIRKETAGTFAALGGNRVQSLIGVMATGKDMNAMLEHPKQLTGN